jgi:hypothetical protein
MKNGCILSAVSIFLLVIAVSLIAAISDGGTNASRSPRTASRSDACFMSQKFIKQNLKAPSTAEFPSWTEANCKATQTGNNWKVRSFVDSQNGFGAMIRSDYGVEMRYNPDRYNWTLLDIMIVSP